LREEKHQDELIDLIFVSRELRAWLFAASDEKSSYSD